MKVFYIFACLILVACTDESFNGVGTKFNQGGSAPDNGSASDSQGNSPNSPNTRVGGDLDVEGNNGQNGNPTDISGGGIDGGTITGGGGNQGPGDPTLCWFVVSGAHFGFHGAKSSNEYSTEFPGTTSGNPIRHGERFDTVGGIYLNASPTPYQYRMGGRIIDEAIDWTFDSIAVAPGMNVEIRDGLGRVLYSGSGPYMVHSNDRPGDSLAHIPGLLRARKDLMPLWMQNYLENRNFVLARIPLHAARYVRVTKLPNVPCAI